jgi:transposase-like protein
MSIKLNILNLVTDDKCYDYLRSVRWECGLICPYCKSKEISAKGRSSHNEYIFRYQCEGCKRGYNDLSETIFAKSNKPLKVWILALYFMGLNLSNRQISQELDLTEKTAQEMTSKLRAGIVKKSLIYNLSRAWKQMKFM